MEHDETSLQFRHAIQVILHFSYQYNETQAPYNVNIGTDEWEMGIHVKIHIVSEYNKFRIFYESARQMKR